MMEGPQPLAPAEFLQLGRKTYYIRYKEISEPRPCKAKVPNQQAQATEAEVNLHPSATHKSKGQSPAAWPGG